jgi:hypothetical protein
MGLSVEVHLDHKTLTEGVDDRETNTMQATRDLVASTAELATRMEGGEHDLQRGFPRGRMHSHRDSATVVKNRHGLVRVQHDLDRVAPAGEGFVDAVVDELDHKVVQATEIRGSDVHPGASANGFETLEDLDLVG